ncbi:MAG: hypothetical protein BWY93_00220 [Euryarchaeota archaeon ADurb.BinA087]|nr:MAG: hypothetical protein BWY93_00220 [Euryarchaeota archaeon ADurb.BinA087]
MKKNSMAIIAIALAIIALLTGTAAAEILAESPHPYPDEYDNAWVITDPGATQMRLHFQRYHLETLGDMIRLYDGGNRLLKTYSGDGINYENVWTDWYPTNFIRVRFTSDSVGDAWGFLIDQRESNAAPTAPASIIYLHNITFQQTSITWIWTDPVSANFDHVMVYLDGVFQTNVTKGIQTFTVQGLSPSTSHTIATQTAGTTGLINQSWVNHTATTAPEPPIQVAPESVSDLHNITFQQTSITWIWTDPVSANFDHVMVYLDGVFQTNVTKGIQTFTVQGLSPSTSHTIATQTAGTTGLINQSWVNHTATTAPEPPIQVAPESVSDLHNITFQQTSITWIWTDPVSANFDHVMVYLDGVFQTNVTKGIQTFTVQGLSPSTSHTIATQTAGTTGLINQSWVNHKATTSPSPDALVLKVTLNGGWNLFSTPVLLEENQSRFSQVFPEVEQGKILVVLGWDGTQWFCPTGSDAVQPLYACFIKVADGEIVNATLIPSNAPSAPPLRTVNKGMNLMGVAPAYDPGTQSFPEMPLNEALVTIEEVGELPGYTIVISPSLNQPGWSYAKGGQVYNVQPFKGYWVFMNNGPDTLAGFSTTPIT